MTGFDCIYVFCIVEITGPLICTSANWTDSINAAVLWLSEWSLCKLAQTSLTLAPGHPYCWALKNLPVSVLTEPASVPSEAALSSWQMSDMKADLPLMSEGHLRACPAHVPGRLHPFFVNCFGVHSVMKMQHIYRLHVGGWNTSLHLHRICLHTFSSVWTSSIWLQIPNGQFICTLNFPVQLNYVLSMILALVFINWNKSNSISDSESSVWTLNIAVRFICSFTCALHVFQTKCMHT